MQEAKVTTGTNVTHSFSYRAGGWGCGIAPTLEMVEAYEYIDGSEGSLKLEENGKSIRFDDPYDVFANKDPRLFASVYFTRVSLAKIQKSNGKRYNRIRQ